MIGYGAAVDDQRQEVIEALTALLGPDSKPRIVEAAPSPASPQSTTPLLARPALQDAPDCCLPTTQDYAKISGNYGNQNYSSLTQIGRRTIRRLGGAWSLHIEDGDDSAFQQSNVVAADGVLYAESTQGSVVAVDGRSGTVKWRYKGAGTPSLRRGVAIGDGNVFTTKGGKIVVALDRKTGAVVWEKDYSAEPTMGSLPTAITYHDGLIFFGSANSVRGIAFALDARTGAEVWRFHGTAGPGDAPLVIRPKTLLPSIVGPATIEGPWLGGGSRPSAVLDGSALLHLHDMTEPGLPRACPGQNKGYGPNVRSLRNPGLAVVDSRSVEISGFEVRNFCIGVLSLRSHGTSVHHMRFENNLGAAAIVVTGDDGKPANPKTGNVAAGTSGDNIIEHNLLIENSDAIDVVRGDTGSRVRFNTLIVRGGGLAVPSSGIETNNKTAGILIEGNLVTGFAEALQIGSDGGKIIGNELTGNVTAVGSSGNRNLFERNLVHGNRIAIGIRPTASGNSLSRNIIYGNGTDFSACAPGGSAGGVCFARGWENSRHSITLAYPTGARDNDDGAACADRAPDCAGGQNAPVLTRAAWTLDGLIAEGQLTSRPNQSFVLEFFASRSPGPADLGEGEDYLASIKVETDARGIARIVLPPALPLRAAGFAGGTTIYLTATATSQSSGTTSQFSRPLLVRLP